MSQAIASNRQKPSSTRIILSGVEGERFFDQSYRFAECRDNLVSFLYIGNKGDKWFQDRANSKPDVKWMIDSGGHSFRKEKFCPKWPDLQWFEDFARRYRDWTITNKDKISLIANLDIDNVVGMQKMVEWDDEIFRPIERSGIPVCYVWHEAYGFDYWMKMCREHEYVGLPGHLSEADFHKMVRPAMMNGCRVHGFAATKSYVLGHVPLATVDSTSWKAGERFGQTFVFESGSLRVFDKNQKDQRKRYKQRWTSMGVDWGMLEQDKAEAITQVCAIAWGDYQKHVDTMSGKLAYWLKTSKLVDDLGEINRLTKDQIKEFYDLHKFTLDCPSDATAQTDLKEIRAFLARDNEAVMAMSDERLEEWLKRLSLTPENSTRSDKEATVRQHLYGFFYKLNAAEMLPRLTDESVEPTKRSLARGEELRPCPSVDVDLPDEAGHPEASEGDFFGLPAPESTPQLRLSGPPGTPENTGDNPTPAPEIATEASTEVVVDTAFTQAITDRKLRARAVLGVELLLEQFDLKHQADVLRVQNRSKNRQKELRQQAAKLAEEITGISEALGETLSDQMMRAALDTHQKILATKAASESVEAKVEADEKRKLALRPQNQRLAQDPAIAAAIGKLGGAPSGNQNARKNGLYSRKMPNLACDNCPHIQVCPQYRAGHVCSFLNEYSRQIESLAGETPEVTAIRVILEEQIKRATRSLLFETFEGGILNKETSRVMRDVQSAAQLLHQMKNPVQRSNPFGNFPPPSNTEPKKDGILSKLFGDLKDASYTAGPKVDEPQQTPTPVQ
jgi:hypothetical protein